LWKKYDPMKLASAQAFRDNPKLVWSWYNDRRRKIMAAKPNVGHLAIANLQNHSEVSVITQNIDGLHQMAGSREVTELHGNIFATRCTKCDFRGEIRSEFCDLPLVVRYVEVTYALNSRLPLTLVLPKNRRGFYRIIDYL
jgi:NAD-dependent deacetylase